MSEMIKGADYVPPEYTEEEMAEIMSSMECEGMCDEHTQYEEGHTPPAMNRCGYHEGGAS
jgi:hypothetical protein